jgi:hypothetical protein
MVPGSSGRGADRAGARRSPAACATIASGQAALAQPSWSANAQSRKAFVLESTVSIASAPGISILGSVYALNACRASALLSIGKLDYFLYNYLQMNKRRSHSDDVLFLSALFAILIGVALLIYTTRTLDETLRSWPIVVLAAGGILLYFFIVRGASNYLLFGGIFCALEGSFLLISVLLGWSLSRVWPICMAIAGFSLLITGFQSNRRLLVSFVVPAIGFVFLGLVFSIFSFGAKGSFLSFIAVWWPSFLIVGGIALFVAYGLSRRARGATKEPGRRQGPPSGV